MKLRPVNNAAREGWVLSRIQRVPVQLLTERAFQPYGEVLAPKEQPADFQGVNSIGWKVRFEIEDAPVIMTLCSSHKGFRFSKVERHFRVTQTFIPIGRVPSIVAVASPTDHSTLPLPEDVTAFVIDGSAGYSLHKGTWHSLDRYPLYPPSSQVVIITSRKTQTEIETADRNDWALTQEVDYEAQFGIIFELSL